MTRKELADSLYEDESRYDEEVCIEDREYSVIYGVTECKSVQVDTLRNGDMVRAQFPSRWCDSRFLNRDQITILE